MLIAMRLFTDKNEVPVLQLDRSIIRRMKVVDWPSALGNGSPVILAGELRGGICKVFGERLIEGQGHGDDGVITAVHGEGESDKAIARTVMEPADFDVSSSGGYDHDLGHNVVPPVDSLDNLAGPSASSPGKSGDLTASQQSEAA